MNPSEISTLNTQLAELTHWTLNAERSAMTRTLHFADFAEAFGFMAQMAVVSERLGHHPEWFNVYNRVDIKLTTHSISGLSDLDTAWAKAADQSYILHSCRIT